MPAAPAQPPSTGGSRLRRLARRTGRLLLFLALALFIALIAGWYAAGREGSLGGTLALVERLLPAGTVLRAEGVSGRLRGGGRIERLRFVRPGLAGDGYVSGALEVILEGVTVDWRTNALFARNLHITTLHVERLTIRDDRVRDPDRPPPPAPPLESLQLPLSIDLPFVIDRVYLAGGEDTAAAAAGDTEDKPLLAELSGSYVYDRAAHRLQIDSLRLADGNYRASARIDGAAPMRAEIDLNGDIDLPAPADAGIRQVQAAVRVHGTLAGEAATLEASADVSAPRHSAVQAAAAPFLTAQARLHPWRANPLGEAHARWHSLDARAFWPTAPSTRLDGQLDLAPSAEAWQAAIQLVNHDAGPWDRGRLPLAALQADARYRAEALDIPRLTARLGGGSVEGRGAYRRDSGGRFDVDLRGIDAALIDSRLANAPIDGGIRVRIDPATEKDEETLPPLAFEASLKTTQRGAGNGKQKTAGAAGLEALELRGQWHRNQLDLPRLLLRLSEATLDGRAHYSLAGGMARAELALRAPGLRASLDGAIGETSGQGKLTIDAADLGQTARWLARWPGLEAVAVHKVDGGARLDVDWRGGYAERGKLLRLDARFAAPKIAIAPPAGAGGAAAQTPIELRGLRLNAAGAPAEVKLDGGGQVRQGDGQLDLAVRGQGGLTAEGWQARLEATRLHVATRAKNAQWQADLTAPGTLSLRQDRKGLQAALDTWRFAFVGPTPAAAKLSVERIRFVQSGKTRTLESTGQLSGLPLAWLEALGAEGTQSAGVAGDLSFDGSWDVRLDRSLALRAALWRSGGDLNLGAFGDLRDEKQRRGAGVRTARLDIDNVDERLRARLAWDSEAAGRMDARLDTRLRRNAHGNWTLPNDAPLDGEVRIVLPNLAWWSIFAPPGWRLRGSLDAETRIAGTLRAPLLNGRIEGNEFGVRSIVDGIALGNGRLRAQFDGQRLNIEEFSLRGDAGTQNGGSLRASGFVALAETTGGQALAEQLDASLDVKLQSLQVSALRDRQILLSGDLTARVKEQKLSLRGKLKVDRALIELPDASAPTLDSDVRIKNGPLATASAPATAKRPAEKPAASAMTPDVEVDIDLGDNLRVRGNGLDTRLAGQLTVRNGTTLSDLPRLTGVVNTERGTFRAYGQRLDIENGTIRFTGSPDNPSLDITAIRPNIDVRVGVRIRGTARVPLVELFSNPAMSDSEKLAWLILGRPSTGGDAALLQQAAFGLLSGNRGSSLTRDLSDALGLDSIGVQGGNNLSEASISMSRRFSRNFYVTYTQGLGATAGLVYFFYDFNRFLKLRAQTGQSNAIDFIFTRSYD